MMILQKNWFASGRVSKEEEVMEELVFVEVVNKLGSKFVPMVEKPEFFQKDITAWLEECEVGCPPGRVRGHAAGVQQMLNSNNDDNDECK